MRVCGDVDFFNWQEQSTRMAFSTTCQQVCISEEQNIV
jgi:hypothetical protein